MRDYGSRSHSAMQNLMFTSLPILDIQSDRKGQNYLEDIIGDALGLPLNSELLREDITYYANIAGLQKNKLGHYTARHTCITNWVKYLYGQEINGRTIGYADIMKLSGHANMETFKKYIDETQLAPPEMVEILDKIAMK